MNNEEQQPLLPPGFHELSIERLREICVDAPDFRTSRARQNLMKALELVIDRLRAAQIEGEMWIGGSFMTTKAYPGDVDVALRLASAYFDIGTKEQIAALTWFTGIYATHRIDGYLFFDYSPTDPRQSDALDDYLHWKNYWGQARDGSPQGIAVIQL